MLPKIDVPLYSCNLPSTKEKVTFRPFLVKEQKLFLMNADNTNPQDTIDVIRQVLKNCIISDIDVDNLPVFDLEYLFINLRGRSVSEVLQLKYKCNNNIPDAEEGEKKCGTVNEVSVNVLEIEPVINPDHTNKIQLTDKIGVVMKYPTFELLRDMADRDGAESVMETIYACLDYIYDENEIYYVKDVSRQELEEFIDGIQQKDLEKIRVFFDTMPKIQKQVGYVCKKCGYHEDITLEGIQDFFG